MKTLLLISTFITTVSFGQTVNSTILDYNETGATISDGGTFFQNHSSNTAGYEFPKNSNRFDYFGMQIWMGGRTDVDTFLILGGKPGLGRDEQNGPILSNGNYSNTIYQDRWSQGIWEISQTEIDLFNEWWLCTNGFSSEGCVDNVETPSNELLNKLENWPATGNISIGEPYWLLPFWDRNSDGSYDINDGDYPIIKGCKSVFLIKNDDLPVKTYSGTESMKIQTVYEFYHLNSQFDKGMNQSTFLNLKVTNFSSNTFDDFSIGVHLDPTQLGERYLGFDHQQNMTYYYINPAFDDNFMPNYPMVGVFPLESPFTSMLHRCFPENNTKNHFNTLKGMINNTDSIIGLSGNPTSFLYDFEPNPLNYSDIHLDTAYDRRSVSSTTYGTFSPNETITQTLAFLSDQDTLIYSNGLFGLWELQPIASSVRSNFDKNNFSCSTSLLGINENESENLISLHPNPVENDLMISGTQILNDIYITDATGKMVLKKINISAYQVKLDVSLLEPGIYFAQSKGSKKLKFIKQ